MKSLYPDDWPEIARAKKEASGWKCERCGAPHGALVIRHLTNPLMWLPADVNDPADEYDLRPVLVQLGVAHLDQNPANNEPSNLAALCRGCHLRHDAPYHAKKARLTKFKKKHERKQSSGQPPLL